MKFGVKTEIIPAGMQKLPDGSNIGCQFYDLLGRRQIEAHKTSRKLKKHKNKIL